MAESIGTGITKGITTVNWNLTEEVRVAPMDKKLLSDYIDACELIRETEQQIRRLEHDVYEIGDIEKRWNKRK